MLNGLNGETLTFCKIIKEMRWAKVCFSVQSQSLSLPPSLPPSLPQPPLSLVLRRPQLFLKVSYQVSQQGEMFICSQIQVWSLLEQPSEIYYFFPTEMNELSLPNSDITSDDVTTITGHSTTGKAPGRNELGWVRRSTRQKRPPTRMYNTTHHLAIEDSESQEEEHPIQRRPKTPNVKWAVALSTCTVVYWNGVGYL